MVAASHWIEREKILLQFVIGLFFLLYGLHGIFSTPSTDYLTLRRRGGIAKSLVISTGTGRFHVQRSHDREIWCANNAIAIEVSVRI